MDNSFPRVSFAKRQYQQKQFVEGSAINLPFKNKSFEAVLLANTVHHLSDAEFLTGIKEMKRVSSKYIIIDDCVKTQDQTDLSKFFYSLDRGTMFRYIDELEEFLRKLEGLKLVHKATHRTFPGLYLHAVFMLEVTK